MRLLAVLAAGLLLAAAAADAQLPVHEPLVLRFPGGTRAAAMANAAMGSRDDEVLFYAPAQLVVARGLGASWQRMGEADLRGVSAVFQSSGFGFGVGAQHLGFHAPAGLPVAPRAVGEDARVDAPAASSSLAAGVARVVKGVRLGLVGRATEDLADGRRARRATVDLGAGRAIGPLHVGLSVQHLGAASDVATLRVRPPTQATVGFNGDGLPLLGSFDLAGGASLSVQRGGRVVPRTGWELSWVWIEGYALQGRVGARRPEWEGQSPLTFGVGFMRDNVSLDYTFEPADGAPTSHRVGIRVR
ncbi:MAG TPA: hypothetical protein VEA99_12085 [Gemmatimonadaceae bacterium]|nr:hypothetical protein [Gemmatimonadaceae bacterium]